ncbi:short-chain dehydrogenase [Streptomyces bungoensis]|uniref:Short-chain dehydrogenase n=1 Tax=Streptomyces bungoensis TaxID=285568 RepID=A0A101SJY5_9ACTN|nr:oxidoreductase [Streptomyces bungoensis]KUN75291.1 short-chain dehydrogenase [Streptomyces bungoensis]
MTWSIADVPDLSGRTALVTGASGGIGRETARVLAAYGAHVVLACRSAERGRAVAEWAGGSTEVLELDLASLDSVRRAAARVRDRHRRLDLLVNNAGVMFPSYRRTADGFEAHFGVNHLGHFALTGLLLDLMTGVPGSRVVTVGSLAHRAGFGRLDADRARSGAGRRSVTAYGRSKLANLLFARELRRRLTVAGAATLSLAAHPGLSPTALWHGDPPALLRPVVAAGMRWLAQPPEAAALPSLRAATDPRVPDGCLGPAQRFGCRGAPVPARSSRAARDTEVQARLWELSEELTGVRYAFASAPAPGEPAVGVCPVTGARG